MADILLVEDSIAEQKLALEAISSAMGPTCDVHVASDGEQALEFLQKRRPLPDLILLDLNLPKIDGREVLRRVKADPELRKIPVLILSSSSDFRDVEACYRLHANCFLTKPLEYDDFCEMAQQVYRFWLRRLGGCFNDFGELSPPIDHRAGLRANLR